MNKRALTLLVVLFAAFGGFVMAAQGSAPGGDDASTVLFRVGNDAVTVDEFNYVYRKNNPAQQDDYSRESLEEYLELYINFKLKVKEARTLRIDTLPGVQSELDRYRRQLVKSYFDKAVTDGMAAEAYDRMMQEVAVNHILVTVQPNASPADSMAAWQRITDIRQRIMSGKDFASIARAESEDPTAKENGGYLGYMTGLQVPDQRFEDAMFNTPAGKISPVLRTRYGYHIVKPGDRRPNRGTVQVAHLLVKVKEGADDNGFDDALDQANAIYTKLQAGMDWDSLVLVHSGDKSTARRGGLLDAFGTGRMVGSFEDAAFSLTEPGQLSEPVKTPYGYHILKLVSREPLAGFEDMKPDIMRKLQRAGRYDAARERFIQSAQKRYGFSENDSVYAQVAAVVDSALLINTWRARHIVDKNATLFTLGKERFTAGDFGNHIQTSQSAYRDRDIATKLDRLYDQFVEEMTVEYALGRRDEGFRRLLQEYRDGILLFELTEERVWQQAMRDTTGLEAFYQAHKTDYLWEERMDAAVYTVSDAKTAKKIRKMVDKGATPDEVRDAYNEALQEPVVTIESGLFLPGQNADVDAAGREKGWGSSRNNEAGQVVMVHIRGVVPPSPKSLSEAKGYVISDYQEFLEDAWVVELRNKYPVKINQSAFDGLIR